MVTCRNCKYCSSYNPYGFSSYYCTKLEKSLPDIDMEQTCFDYRGPDGETDSVSCYLTSACVGYLGKPDDCHELTTLRTFRDGYLKKTAEGSALIEQYYEIAPKIVEKIEASGKQKEYYEYIYGVVTECVAYIEKGDSEGALARYRDMTLTLKEKLL